MQAIRPFFFKSVKIEHGYRKAQTMFEGKQESLINHSSLSYCATATKPHVEKVWKFDKKSKQTNKQRNVVQPSWWG